MNRAKKLITFRVGGERYAKGCTENRPTAKMGLPHEESRHLLPGQFQFSSAAPQYC